MPEIRVKIRAQTPELVHHLFGPEEITPHETVQIAEGAEVVMQRYTRRQGFVDSGIILDLVLKVATGVATKLLADWLADKLKGKNAQLVVGDTVVATDAKNIETAIKTCAGNEDAAERSAIGHPALDS